MKEIGLKLKLKREENGVSIEEAASDLKMRPSQLTSIEEGKKEDFKDVFSLKYFIRDYAKYLGLDGEEMLDEFNEYLFDYTSKISLDDYHLSKVEVAGAGFINLYLDQKYLSNVVFKILNEQSDFGNVNVGNFFSTSSKNEAVKLLPIQTNPGC